MDRDKSKISKDILREIGLNDDQMWYVETLLDNLEDKIEAYRHEIGEMKRRGYTREKS